MKTRPDMVRETLAALAAGAILLMAYGGLSQLPQESALQSATYWVASLLSVSVAVLVWRLIARRR